MQLSESTMNTIVAQIRAAEAAMTSAVGELADEWSGNDADAFQRDWSSQVHSPLRDAAARLDVASFEKL